MEFPVQDQGSDRLVICDALRHKLSGTQYRPQTETDQAAELQREGRSVEMDKRLRQGGSDE